MALPLRHIFETPTTTDTTINPLAPEFPFKF